MPFPMSPFASRLDSNSGSGSASANGNGMNVRHTIVWSEEHVRPGKLVFDTTMRRGSRELEEGK
jgi:hypothetical protein